MKILQNYKRSFFINGHRINSLEILKKFEDSETRCLLTWLGNNRCTIDPDFLQDDGCFLEINTIQFCNCFPSQYHMSSERIQYPSINNVIKQKCFLQNKIHFTDKKYFESSIAPGEKVAAAFLLLLY